MTLTLLFRIQAVVMAFFGVGMLFAASTMMESFGVSVTENPMMPTIMQTMSIMALSIAYFSWKAPDWVGNNIKAVGMFSAVIHVAFVAIAIYQHMNGTFPIDGFAVAAQNIGPDVILGILFLWKSR
jgi:hypothetical protein